jgi:hypothetical protein
LLSERKIFDGENISLNYQTLQELKSGLFNYFRTFLSFSGSIRVVNHPFQQHSITPSLYWPVASCTSLYTVSISTQTRKDSKLKVFKEINELEKRQSKNESNQ